MVMEITGGILEQRGDNCNNICMRIKEFEISDPNNPFQDCLLNREPFGHILTSLISGMEEGGVVSLNNEWGTGKSTFLKMWKQQLSNDGFITLEFNAWENDYEDNPLIPLISEIKDSIGKKDEGSFERILEVGSKLLLEGGGMIAKKAISKIVGDRGADNLVDIVTGQAEEILKEEISVYKQKKSSLTEFKKLLGNYLAEIDNQKLPLVFIIDELDRCRPDYAVKVLESIKHMFSVPNIVFIVSIDKTQLMHSINGFYGSENINSEEYLRRFFDLELNLPDPDKKGFIKTLLKARNIITIMSSRLYAESAVNNVNLIEKLLSKLTLRQIEKYVVYLSIAIKSERINIESYRIFFYLLFLKLYSNEDYKNLQNLTLDNNQIANLFATNSIDLQDSVRQRLELEFATAYNNMLLTDLSKRSRMYYNYTNPEDTFVYKSLINGNFQEDYLKSYDGRFPVQNLDTIINIIDMMS